MVGIIAVLFYFSCMIAQTVLCVPLEHLWNQSIKGYCFPYGTFLICAVSLELAMDATVLALPIPMIMNLHLPVAKKMLIAGVFLLGGL